MPKASDYTVGLSDGHGMGTQGKATPFISELGKIIHENEFNRAVVKYLDENLKRCGFKTILVAPTDYDTPLTERTNLINQKGADIYVSIHYNALDGKFDGNGKDPEGFSLHVYPGSVKDRVLAESILKYLKNGTVQKNRGIVESNFHELREAKCPAVLSENGFMDNKAEALLMLNVNFQKEVAEEHARGICDYFGVKYIEDKVIQNVEVKVEKEINKDMAQSVKRYKNISEMDPWMQTFVKQWVASGYIKGNDSGDLDFDDDMVRILIITERMIDSKLK